MALINIGPLDLANSVSFPVPASGTNFTTGIIDLQAVGPNSDAARLGRIAIVVPAMPEANVVANTITIAIQGAPASLLAGNTAIAPALPPPGAFATQQTITLAGIVNGGIPAQVVYASLPFDGNGTPYQFLQFLVTTGAINTLNETMTIGLANA